MLIFLHLYWTLPMQMYASNFLMVIANLDFPEEISGSCYEIFRLLTPFLWSDAGSAKTGSRQEVRPETQFQTWSISAVANLQNIAAVRAISAPTEKEGADNA